MARVTATEVKAIMNNCTATDSTVGTFILAANKLVSEVFEDSDLDSSMLKEIERYLTAHIISSTVERQTTTEKLGDAAVTYAGKWGDKLSSTSYGQIAMMLDTEGLLAKSGKQSATITAIESFD
jgi:hypothetical protein